MREIREPEPFNDDERIVQPSARIERVAPSVRFATPAEYRRICYNSMVVIVCEKVPRLRARNRRDPVVAPTIDEPARRPRLSMMNAGARSSLTGTRRGRIRSRRRKRAENRIGRETRRDQIRRVGTKRDLVPSAATRSVRRYSAQKASSGVDSKIARSRTSIPFPSPSLADVSESSCSIESAPS